tara:strand:+ start:3091 stop:4989 length:1899 start_codon:yes stop_codon:yes gene_type:complete
MPLLPLEIPAGVYRNGTEYQAKNRWYETNLVRWREGLLEPIGGWTKYTDTQIDGKARGMLAWRANDSTRWLAVGTNKRLYSAQGGTIYDITPANFVEGKESSIPGFGWGAGLYGSGSYGTQRATSINIELATWSMENWGEYMVACSTTDGRVVEYQIGVTGGLNRVTNGVFSADSSWSKGTGWAINSDVAKWTGTTVTNLRQTVTGLVNNKTHEVLITLVDPDVDSNAATIPSAKVKITGSNTSTVLLDKTLLVGDNVLRFVTDDTSVLFDVLAATASQPAFNVDNVSLKLVPAAVVVANAPVNNVGIVVTNERHLVCLGAGGNKRKVQWSTQEDNTVWTAAATNTAGSLELETAGQIRCAKKVGNDILIWTDTDVHLMRYVGPPFVYGIERVGSGAGIVGPKAVTVAGNTAIWLSESGFWTYDGGVKPLSCDAVLEVTDLINRQQQGKTFAGHNSEFGEFWFFYPSSSTDSADGENDKYIAYNYRLSHWMVGSLARTAWADQGAFDLPFATSADGYIYQHESGFTNDGSTRVGTVFAETGPIEVGQGDRFAVINRIISDEYSTVPSVQATISTKNSPQDTESSAQFVFNQADGYVDTRINARQLQIKLEAVLDDGFKFGTLRMDMAPGSRR